MDRILWCLLLIEINAAAALQNCPTSQYKFEKILGLRPRDSTRSLLLYKSEGNGTLAPVTAECVAKCRTDDECRSFVLYYRKSQCYYFKTDIDVMSPSIYQLDNDAAWFVKTCFSTGKICDKMWIFERIPGAILIGNDTKSLPGYISRTDCQSFCLNETQFSCRSAKFKLRTSSNLGRCTLSDADRHQLPSAYRVSGYDEEYFENECTSTANVLHNTDFCSYEEYDNVILTHSDMVIRRKSREDCQTMCDDLDSFNCRAFSVINGNNDCYLHAEDSKIFGPTMLKENSKSTYYEKARCLNLTVSCTEAYMTIKYDPELNFQGKIYMQSFSGSPQCTANGEGKFEMVTLKLPLLSSQCGIVKAEGAQNRTLLSGTLIIQYNSIIQTQSDRVIRVGCIFGNDSKVVVGTGVKISSMLPNKGSSLLNPSSNATITSPTVEMRIVDFNSHREVSDTQIGQELQLVISMKSKNSNWDIWARHLVAMTEKSDESIFLLDDSGCPTNLNIFPPLERVVSNDSKQLVASFQAFKFATSPIIRFSAIVQFCEKECPQIDCGSNVVSYGRKKREVSAFMLQTVNGTTVVRINRTDFRGKSSLLNEIPLEYIMVVRDAKSVSDRLVYGENTRVLVAGYDYSTQEVCFDYSFVIGLIVTWILVQIVFVVGCIVLVRRYKKYYQHECTTQSLEELHKNFGIGFSNLENRRVRWADNDTM